MSTAPDPKFPNFPGLIFGLSPTQHRRDPIKMLLARYNVKVRSNDKKEEYLEKLIDLEKSIGEREKEALLNWFAGENTCRSLAALLGDALKPPIIPKDTGEPLAKKTRVEEQEDQIFFAAVNVCRICMESNLPAERFPQTRITRTCAHHPAVCNDCLTKHINEQVQIKASDQIQCPECLENVSNAEIKAYASPEVLERNCRKAFMMSRQHLPYFTFCLNVTCESGQQHTGPEQPMMKCNDCGFKTCFIHKIPWHEGLTCAEFDKLNQDRVQQEAASEAWIAENAKPCPNAKCGIRVEKKVGCDHLTCDYCNFEFCWSCCADFSIIKKKGNDHHKEGCQWHTKNKNGLPGHGRRRVPVPRKPNESKEPKAAKKSGDMKESKTSMAGKTSKEAGTPEAAKKAETLKELKLPEAGGKVKEVGIPEDEKKPIESGAQSGSAQATKDTGAESTQSSVPENVEGSTEQSDTSGSEKPLETTNAMDFINTNQSKRRRED